MTLRKAGASTTMKKQNRRDPIKVMLILTVCMAVLAAGCMLLGNAISAYRANTLAQLQAEVEAINEQRDQEYARALAEFEAERRVIPDGVAVRRYRFPAGDGRWVSVVWPEKRQ